MFLNCLPLPTLAGDGTNAALMKSGGRENFPSCSAAAWLRLVRGCLEPQGLVQFAAVPSLPSPACNAMREQQADTPQGASP